MSKAFYVVLVCTLIVASLIYGFYYGVFKNTCYNNLYPRVIGATFRATGEAASIKDYTTTDFTTWETIPSETTDLSEYQIISGAIPINATTNSILSYILVNLHEAKVKKVMLLISCYGGIVDDTMAMHDTIMFFRGQGMEIYTVANGYCYSGGAILLQAGTKRFMTRHALLMLHNARCVAAVPLSEIPDIKESIKRCNGQMRFILLERTGTTEAGSLLDKQGAHWINPKEALRLKLVDGVL